MATKIPIPPGGVQWSPDSSKFLNPATGQWTPSSQFFETFDVPSSQTTSAIPFTGGGASFNRPGSSSSYSAMPGGDYGTSTFGDDGMMDDGGGWWDTVKGWFDDVDAGDVLKAGGAALGGYLDYDSASKARGLSDAQFKAGLGQREAEFARTLAQRQAEEARRTQEFDRATGNTEAQLAVQAQTAINKAPLADKAQALLLSRMGVAPTQFQARDYTRDVNEISGRATGGPSDQIAAARTAAANYTPGSGGVDTAAAKLMLERMMAGARQGMPSPAPTDGAAVAGPVTQSLRPNDRRFTRPHGTGRTTFAEPDEIEEDVMVATDVRPDRRYRP